MKIGMVQGDGEVSETDEKRTDENEKSDAFQHERQSFRFSNLKKNHKKPKNGKALIKNEVYVESRNVIEDDIRHGIAGPVSRIDIGESVDDETGGKKQKSQKDISSV